ncbi:hypothetical protein MNBD_IGNAVI01-1945 [hydrothermal vent metagenome]|uniref:PpiC domain-containing protein n=1 Tax=hydrothermal vent metagenome TaxID=652676 RepID=A0A3B1C5I8_9ZZZZ
MKIVKFILPFLFITLLFLSCGKKAKRKVDPKYIVAVIGKDTIFVNDIIMRSEYNVRPPYCDNDKMYDKRVILNSLIAEHLYAMETDKNVFSENKIYSARLQGMKEQFMREKLIQVDVVDKIKIPQKEIDQAYINSKKIISTEAVFIPKGFDPEVMYKAVQKGVPFNKLAELYPGVSKVVKKSVKWGSMDEEAQKAIFNKNVRKGTVIKPLPAKDGYRLIKVTGWVEEVEMSPGNINQQKESIRSKIMDYYIQKNYKEYAQDVMHGKRIDYFKDGWNALVKILQPLYVHSKDSTGQLRNDEIDKFLSDNNTVLMNIDGKNWTIKDLINAMKIHPLEISEQKLTSETFPFKLQAAIAGLITDTYFTNIAYDRGYDKSYDVNRKVKQWDRYYKASYQRDKVLAEANYNDTLTINYFKAFEKYLNPYFEKLKRKYDSEIRYNPKALESIKLTNLQTVTYKEKGPYKEVVPPFPLITNSNKTNYKHLSDNLRLKE